MRKTGLIMLLVIALAPATVVRAQDYPNKPIKLIVPFVPGGATDRVARVVGDKLREKWGQAVIVENHGGAGGNIGAEMTYKAAPDGYTIMYAAPGQLVINKLLYPKLGYDSDAFVPLSLISTSPNVLVVGPKLSADTLLQLIARLKSNPDRFNYASSGAGTTSHLSAEMFKWIGGFKMTHVPFKGSGPAITDLVAGHVDMAFLELSSVLPQVRAGKLRLLGVGSEKRNSFMPDSPALAEAMPGFVSTTWAGMVAPPKTPAAIANRLGLAINEALKQPDVAKWLYELSVEVIGGTPAEMAQFIKLEKERWGNVIRATGAQAD